MESQNVIGPSRHKDACWSLLIRVTCVTLHDYLNPRNRHIVDPPYNIRTSSRRSSDSGERVGGEQFGCRSYQYWSGSRHFTANISSLTRITEIRFKEYGVQSLEVIDNGSGVAEADHDSIGAFSALIMSVRTPTFTPLA